MKKELFRLTAIFVVCLGVIIFPGLGNRLVQHAQAATIYFESGWENGQDQGINDTVAYSQNVAGYFNSSNPPPECSRRPGETVRTGNYSLMIAGYSRADYAYCYYRVFDLHLDVVPGMKIGYWIYHTQGTSKIAVDGHFTDGNTLRDFGNGALQDQYGVRIHPALRQDPMSQWYYVEVDLSPAAGKTLDTIMFAFDNGGDKFIGPYRAYVDDVKIFKENPCQASVSETNWKGEYFNNMTLSGAPSMVRDDGDGFLKFDWGLGSPNSSCGIGEDHFSVRWTKSVNFPPGNYQFTVTGDDGVRFWIDDQLKLDKWFDQGPTDYPVGPIYLTGSHTLRMEYYENAIGAVAKLSWQKVEPPVNHCQASVSETNWKGEYFNNMALNGTPSMIRHDGEGFLNFDWDLGSPDSSCGLGEDRFSVRWTRKVDFPPGNYQFTVTPDDGARFWIDDQLKLDKWFDQPPTDYKVGPVYLSGNHILRMEYYENAVGAVAKLSWVRVDQPPTHCQASVPADHWKGEYFNNMTLSGTPLMVRDDGQEFLNFDWGLGSPESSCGIGIDHFSVRWTRRIDFIPGQYQFTATVDDGVRLYIDDQLQFEKWIDQPPTPYTVGPIYLSGSHTLRMEYYENSGGAVGKLSWLQVGPPPFTGTLFFQNGWEEGQIQGFKDRVEYSQNVTDARSNPRSRETAHDGNGSFMISGVSQGSNAYSYHRVFDVEIPVKKGLKIGYWIYHAQGTPKVALDGHFSDGTVFRDLNNNGFLADQYGVRIHPASRNDPMFQWYYVEVDLSKAEGKTIDYLMFAFDNGGDGFTGSYRTYADDLKIFYGEMQSLTQGQPKGNFGSGRQTDLVTEPEQWRWAPDFYGQSGLDDIASRVDACGVQRSYAMGFHQNDLVEYLMKFGGEFNRLWLRGMASQPGPVKMEIYIDGQYRAITAWDANSNCSQDVALNIQGIPYGTHAIAIKFVNDSGGPASGFDRNMLLEGLFVTRSGEVRSRWAYPVGTADSAEGWAMTNALGETFTNWYSGHLGEDWAKYGDSFGEPVYATGAGRVITVLPRCGNYLNVLVIEHNVEGFGEPLYSFYGHVDTGNVREGDWVERRQQIATVGNPRPDFEPHLHFEIKNRTALLQGPFSPCTDVSKGWYISAGYSRLVNDYDSRNDYYTPSNGNKGSRFYHPRRFIEGNLN